MTKDKKFYHLGSIFSIFFFRVYLCSCLLFFAGCSRQNINHGEEISNEFIINWNHLAYQIAYEHDQFYSLIGVRALTMMHLAMHDALNAVNEQYERYTYQQNHPDADPVLAASQSAYEILVNIYPGRKDTIESFFHKLTDQKQNENVREESILLGKKIATVLFQKRENDGHRKQGDYTPMSKPGDYQYTPGWNNWVLKPDFRYAMPFALDTVTQFRSPPPPSLVSKEYTDSFNEVKEYGRKASNLRSPEQTNIAHWWAEFAEHSWNRIGRITARARNLPAWETARMFALINMDIYDIYLASLESKYFYDTWRPYTAIRQAGVDNNPETLSDIHWEPEMLTPPWPEYPSAHAAVGAGGAEIVRHVFGTADISFTMESITGLPAARQRTYHNLLEAANDCAESRILNGYHFRFATKEGKRQGQEIASFIHSNFLRSLNK